MKLIKPLLSTIMFCFAASASAQCVVTSEYLTAVSIKKDIPELDCKVKGYIKDRTLRNFDSKQMFTVSIRNNAEITKVDLSGLDSALEYTANFTGSENLEELEIGYITRFGTLSLQGTKITDLRFLENVTNANIFTNQVTHFPDDSSPFCESVKAGKAIEITSHDKSPYLTNRMRSNCGVED